MNHSQGNTASSGTTSRLENRNKMRSSRVSMAGCGMNASTRPCSRHLPMPAEVLASWKDDYNTVRPHSGLGNLAPSIYAGLRLPRCNGDAALHRGLRAPSRCITEPSRLKSTRGSTHRWMKEGAQVSRPTRPRQRASMRRLLTGLGSVALARCDSGFEDNSQQKLQNCCELNGPLKIGVFVTRLAAHFFHHPSIEDHHSQYLSSAARKINT